MINIFIVIFLFITTDSFAQVSRSINKQYKPMYEFGIGAGYFSTPNYPGSKATTTRFIPFPFFIYRGDILRADDDGTRARLFNSKKIELGLSLGFNFPIYSSRNNARRGMPDTGALLGFGPGILYKYYEGKNHRLIFKLGLRANLNIDQNDFKSSEQGIVLQPSIRYWFRPSKNKSVTIYSGLSVSYADQKYNAYFYDVEKKFETNLRKSYKSSAGLIQYTHSIGLSYFFSNNLSVYLGGFYRNLTTSANKSSYLLEQQHTYGMGVGFIWPFLESSKKVK